jgi:hypothetical protein
VVPLGTAAARKPRRALSCIPCRVRVPAACGNCAVGVSCRPPRVSTRPRTAAAVASRPANGVLRLGRAHGATTRPGGAHPCAGGRPRSMSRETCRPRAARPGRSRDCPTALTTMPTTTMVVAAVGCAGARTTTMSTTAVWSKRTCAGSHGPMGALPTCRGGRWTVRRRRMPCAWLATAAASHMRRTASVCSWAPRPYGGGTAPHPPVGSVPRAR